MPGGFADTAKIQGLAGIVKILAYDGTDKTVSDFDLIDPAFTTSAEGIGFSVEYDQANWEAAEGGTITWDNRANVMAEFNVGERSAEIVALITGQDPATDVSSGAVALFKAGQRKRWVVLFQDPSGNFSYILQNAEFMTEGLPGFKRTEAGVAVKMMGYMNKGTAPGSFFEAA